MITFEDWIQKEIDKCKPCEEWISQPVFAGISERHYKLLSCCNEFVEEYDNYVIGKLMNNKLKDF